MNGTFGARRLRRFNVPPLRAIERGSGVNAALQFRGSTRETFRGILSPELILETRESNEMRRLPNAALGGIYWEAAQKVSK